MSLGSKVKGSIAGMIFGIIFLLGALAAVWWNEGRTVKNHYGLKQGNKEVFSSENINYIGPENDEKLIHVSGMLATSDQLIDSDFGISTSALKLKRKVECYQWKENKKTKKEENSDKSQTTYEYEQVWKSQLINSDNFFDKSDHVNPKSKRFADFSKIAKPIKIGEHHLTDTQINRVNHWIGLKIEEITDQDQAVLQNSEGASSIIYIGKSSPVNPEIGDLRISYKVVNPDEYSIIAKQSGNSFQAFETKKGTQISMIKRGRLTAENMFEAAVSENKTVKWLFRIGGVVILFLGVRMLFSPLTTFTSKIPVLGSLLNFGISIFSAIVASSLALVTAGIAWVFYRPVIGISLLALGAGIFIYFKMKSKNTESLSVIN